jgi:hypothetical protein
LFDLDGEWEVGLSEIQFPITWYNLAEEETHLFVRGVFDNEQYENVSPPGGYYESPESLVKQINLALSSRGIGNVRFTFNEISKKITVTYKNVLISILMTKTLAELLGFTGKDTFAGIVFTDLPQKQQDEIRKKYGGDPQWNQRLAEVEYELLHLSPEKNDYQGEFVCDLQRGFYSLYVYCDVCEPTVVGEFKVPLLRTVNISGKEGSMIGRLFQRLQYVPVQRKQFDMIEIDLRDDVGKKVAFQRGKVIVTLHFRLRKPSYF